MNYQPPRMQPWVLPEHNAHPHLNNSDTTSVNLIAPRPNGVTSLCSPSVRWTYEAFWMRDDPSIYPYIYIFLFFFNKDNNNNNKNTPKINVCVKFVSIWAAEYGYRRWWKARERVLNLTQQVYCFSNVISSCSCACTTCQPIQLQCTDVRFASIPDGGRSSV